MLSSTALGYDHVMQLLVPATSDYARLCRVMLDMKPYPQIA